jgi:hypothetical protein
MSYSNIMPLMCVKKLYSSFDNKPKLTTTGQYEPPF